MTAETMRTTARPSTLQRPWWKRMLRALFWPLTRRIGDLHERLDQYQAALRASDIHLQELRWNFQAELNLLSGRLQRQDEALVGLRAENAEISGRLAAWLAGQDMERQAHMALQDDYARRIGEQHTGWVELGVRADALKQNLDRLDSGLSNLQIEVRPRLHQMTLDQRATQRKLEADDARLNAIDAGLSRLENPAGPGFNYSAFEDRFRGEERVILERQAVYLPLLSQHAPVADLGCGRGELLELLHGAKVPALGIDRDAGQVQRCRGKGLNVEQTDLFVWLDGQPDASLGAVTLLQVIEHLDIEAQRRMIAAARRVLQPGGVLLMETVNPHCPEALEWFYIDPTHRRPVYPELLQLLLEQAGFNDITVRFQSPSSTAPAGIAPNEKTGADFALWGYAPAEIR